MKRFIDIRTFFHKLSRFFVKLKRYLPLVWKDNEFDYWYLDKVVVTKLKWMSDYFRVTRIVEGEEETYRQVNRAYQIGKIALEEEYFEEEKYVNIRNFHRFCPNSKEESFRDGTYAEWARKDLRAIKARHLLYAYIAHYGRTWWD